MNGPLKPLEAQYSLDDWFSPQGGPPWRQLMDHWTQAAGISADFFSAKLSSMPDPFSLKNLRPAVERFAQMLLGGKKVLILGDYDVDGVTSTALVVRVLRTLGFSAQAVIPNRFREGYGLTPAVVQRILALKPDLVLTVDNGITAKEEVARLRQAGVEVIVTDHHLCVESKVPDGLVINPKQPDCPFEAPDISGVGLAFMFLVGLRSHLRDQGFFAGRSEPNLLEHLDLVALGSVADQVPLTGLNRLLTARGIEQLRRRLKEPQGPGGVYLQSLAQAQRLHFIDAETLAFRLAPLINAAGRMQDGALALDFLLEEDPARSAALLDQLTRLNQERKKRQTSMAHKASELAQPQYEQAGIALVFEPSFHEGLLGIVASRLCEQFGGPALVCTQAEDGRIKGSARSKGANLLALFESCAEHLEVFGGHAQAAGCSFGPDQLDPLRAALAQASQAAPLGPPAPEADLEILPEMISPELVEALKALEPFGMGNKKPVFLVRQWNLPQPRQLAAAHLKWDLSPGVELIRWDGVREDLGSGRHELAFTLGENRFRGQVSLQLIAQSIRPVP